MWLQPSKRVENNEKRDSEEEFKSFVKEEVKDLSFDDDFLTLALVFFNRERGGVEPSLAIPGTSTMVRLREQQMRIALESVESAQAPLKGKFDWLKQSDLKEISEKTSRKLREKSGGTVVKEEIERLVNEGIAALFEERMKVKK